ncbi:MAG: FAD-binding oxidoreductase [Saprospiraceae bacterium]|nr:FAD-binding oxidoreductase [Saprospiraceae bacterium]
MRKSIAILGAGIMGSSLALFLARKGYDVKLIDMAEQPFTGASRWNEGKIHLGYLYSGDRTLKTAKKLIPGGLAFTNLVSELMGREVTSDLVTSSADHYLIHKKSVVKGAAFREYAQKISLLTQEHPLSDQYFISLDKNIPKQLSRTYIDNHFNPAIVSDGFEIPERSVQTNTIADYFIDALDHTPTIEKIMHHEVLAVHPSDKIGWSVSLSHSGKVVKHNGFDLVINALWQNRIKIDQTANMDLPASWTHRYRVSLFGQTSQIIQEIPSAVIAVGPFGDIKNYDGKHWYLSWYDAGLISQSHDINPPKISLLDHEQLKYITTETINQLGAAIPAVSSLVTKFETLKVKGGWVYAVGQGDLGTADSQLHKRDRVGYLARQGYISVDTGKYSLAPWMAKKLVEQITQ